MNAGARSATLHRRVELDGLHLLLLGVGTDTHSLLDTHRRKSSLLGSLLYFGSLGSKLGDDSFSEAVLHELVLVDGMALSLLSFDSSKVLLGFLYGNVNLLGESFEVSHVIFHVSLLVHHHFHDSSRAC